MNNQTPPKWQQLKTKRLLAHQEVACALLAESRPHLSLGPVECLQQLAAYVLHLGNKGGGYTWGELGDLCTDYAQQGILPKRLEQKIECLLAEWV